ncbi:hypothetical protein [Dokdonia sp.]|uniref:hypothetical protein n=1 Tax=Dokdonia sp. TaxID=2024995 RepID=UPI00326386DA
MALQIKKIDNVFCVNGKATASQAVEVQQFFKALLQCTNTVLVNLCGVYQGVNEVEKALDVLKKDLKKDQEFTFYSFTPEAAARQYDLINDRTTYRYAA